MKMANCLKFDPAQLAIEEAKTQIWVHFNFDFCFSVFFTLLTFQLLKVGADPQREILGLGQGRGHKHGACRNAAGLCPLVRLHHPRDAPSPQTVLKPGSQEGLELTCQRHAISSPRRREREAEAAGRECRWSDL